MRDEKGQSLLEMTISLGLLSIVVTTLGVLVVNGLRNSQFSNSQSQATKYAQEGVEIVRTIKSRNYNICGVNADPTASYIWSDTWADSSCSPDDPCTYVLESNSNCSTDPTAETPLGLRLSNVPEELAGGMFKREIIISQYRSGMTTYANQKKVTVRVSWQDQSGERSSQVETILSNLE